MDGDTAQATCGDESNRIDEWNKRMQDNLSHASTQTLAERVTMLEASHAKLADLVEYLQVKMMRMEETHG